MNKQKFNELKNKFTDGNGTYTFPVGILEMNNSDLRDYIDYIHEKYVRASFFTNTYTYRAICNANAKQHEYTNILYSISKNRPDFELTEQEKEIAKFKN